MNFILFFKLKKQSSKHIGKQVITMLFGRLVEYVVMIIVVICYFLPIRRTNIFV